MRCRNTGSGDGQVALMVLAFEFADHPVDALTVSIQLMGRISVGNWSLIASA
jgi:hypothetical protein